jgi:hypothetical protein
MSYEIDVVALRLSLGGIDRIRLRSVRRDRAATLRDSPIAPPNALRHVHVMFSGHIVLAACNGQASLF